MENKEMTLKQAVSILDQASSGASLTRQEHILVQQAVQLLSKFVASQESELEPESEGE